MVVVVGGVGGDDDDDDDGGMVSLGGVVRGQEKRGVKAKQPSALRRRTTGRHDQLYRNRQLCLTAHISIYIENCATA